MGYRKTLVCLALSALETEAFPFMFEKPSLLLRRCTQFHSEGRGNKVTREEGKWSNGGEIKEFVLFALLWGVWFNNQEGGGAGKTVLGWDFMSKKHLAPISLSSTISSGGASNYPNIITPSIVVTFTHQLSWHHQHKSNQITPLMFDNNKFQRCGQDPAILIWKWWQWSSQQDRLHSKFSIWEKIFDLFYLPLSYVLIKYL